MEVNLSEPETVCTDAWSRIDFDEEKEEIHLLRLNGHLWRYGASDTVGSRVAGGGASLTTEKGAKERLAAMNLENCHSFVSMPSDGTIWCSDYFQGRLLKISPKDDTIEVMIGRQQAKKFEKTENLSSASVDSPLAMTRIQDESNVRLLFADTDPKGVSTLRALDFSTQKISTICEAPRIWNLVNPSLLHCKILGVPSTHEFTWIHCSRTPESEEYETKILNLSTGAHETLFPNIVHPIATIDHCTTLAVEVSDSEEAFLVFAFWSFKGASSASSSSATTSNSTENIMSSYIKRIAALPGVWRSTWTQSVVFYSSSNQLLLSSGNGHLLRYKNIFRDKQRVLRPTFAPNLELLLDAPDHYSDLEIVHKASNTTWRLHYDILMTHQGLETRELVDRRLAATLRHTTVSVRYIEYFLKYLYLKPIVTSAPEENFLEISFSIMLCEAIGLNADYLLNVLSTKVITKLPNETFLKLALELWMEEYLIRDPASSRPPESISYMNVFAQRSRIYIVESDIPSAIDTFEKFPKNFSVALVAKACSTFTSFMHPLSTRHLSIPKMSERSPRIFVEAIKWEENLDVKFSGPASDPYAYIFRNESKVKDGIVVKSWLLYAQWQWFKRLIKSKLEETITRHVVLPDWCTPNILLAILSPFHGARIEPIMLRLSREEAGTIIFRFEYFQLDESPSHHRLLEWCQSNVV